MTNSQDDIKALRSDFDTFKATTTDQLNLLEKQVEAMTLIIGRLVDNPTHELRARQLVDFMASNPDKPFSYSDLRAELGITSKPIFSDVVNRAIEMDNHLYRKSYSADKRNRFLYYNTITSKNARSKGDS